MRGLILAMIFLSSCVQRSEESKGSALGKGKHFSSSLPGMLEIETKFLKKNSNYILFNGRGFVLSFNHKLYGITNTHLSQGFDEKAQQNNIRIFKVNSAIDREELEAEKVFLYPSLDLTVIKFTKTSEDKLSAIAEIRDGKIVASQEALLLFKEDLQSKEGKYFSKLGALSAIPKMDYGSFQTPVHEFNNNNLKNIISGRYEFLQANRVLSGFDVSGYEYNTIGSIINGMSGSPVFLQQGDKTVTIFGMVTAKSRVFQESWLLQIEHIQEHLTEVAKLESQDQSPQVFVNLENMSWHEQYGLLYRRGQLENVGYDFQEIAQFRSNASDGTRSDGTDGSRSDGGDGSRSDGGGSSIGPTMTRLQEKLFATYGLLPGIQMKKSGSAKEENILAINIEYPNGRKILVPAEFSAIREIANYGQNDGKKIKNIEVVTVNDNPLKHLRRHFDQYYQKINGNKWHSDLSVEKISDVNLLKIGQATVDISAETEFLEDTQLNFTISWFGIVGKKISFSINKKWEIIQGNYKQNFRFIPELRESTSDEKYSVDLAGLLMHDLSRTRYLGADPRGFNPIRFKIAFESEELDFYNHLIIFNQGR